MKRSHHILVASFVSAAVVAGLLSACSTPPKPKELVEFEAMRADKYTKQIRETKEAGEFISASDDFYTLAIEAYDDEEMKKVEEYSLLGTMRYRTAKAIARDKDAKARLSAANEKYLKQQQIRNDLNETRKEVEQTIAALEKAMSLRADLEDTKLKSATKEEELKAKLALEKQKADAEKNIESAKTKLAAADGMKAGEHAPRNYGMGKNMLKAAETHFKKEKFEEATKSATDAIEMLDKAMVEAKPKYEAEQAIVARDEQNKKLFELAHNRFRDLVRVDGRGTIVTVHSLFKPRKTDIQADRYYDLDFVAELAKKFPDYKILIEGHTDDRGAAAKNITISQARAESVRNYFLQRGLKSDRFQVSGAGEEKPFFKNRGRERLKNNRVDVIFLNK